MSLSMSIITLTTDFGSADGYVGAMKGVILGIAPDVRLVDLRTRQRITSRSVAVRQLPDSAKLAYTERRLDS